MAKTHDFYSVLDIFSFGFGRSDSSRRIEAKSAARQKLLASEEIVRRAASSRARLIEELETFEAIVGEIRDGQEKERCREIPKSR